MYKHQKNYKNDEFSPSHFLSKFGQTPCTIVQGLWPNFKPNLKIHKKSKFEQNQFQLKHSTQYKTCTSKCV